MVVLVTGVEVVFVIVVVVVVFTSSSSSLLLRTAEPEVIGRLGLVVG